MTEGLLIPAMFVAALVIFWTAVALVWWLGRRGSTHRDSSGR